VFSANRYDKFVMVVMCELTVCRSWNYVFCDKYCGVIGSKLDS